MQTEYCAYPSKCYLGEAPTLVRVEKTYGKEVAISWLELQIENFEDFANITEKLDIEKEAELAKVILCNFYYLKVTELMLFFMRLKSGKYGKLYNKIDTIWLTNAIRLFLGERNIELDNYIKIEEERSRTKANTEKQGLITYEEYKEKLKSENNGENEKK